MAVKDKALVFMPAENDAQQQGEALRQVVRKINGGQYILFDTTNDAPYQLVVTGGVLSVQAL